MSRLKEWLRQMLTVDWSAEHERNQERLAKMRRADYIARMEKGRKQS